MIACFFLFLYFHSGNYVEFIFTNYENIQKICTLPKELLLISI